MEALFSEPARERLISKTKLLHDTLISCQEFDSSLYSLPLSLSTITSQLPSSTDSFAQSITTAYLNTDMRETITPIEEVMKEKKIIQLEEAKQSNPAATAGKTVE